MEMLEKREGIRLGRVTTEYDRRPLPPATKCGHEGAVMVLANTR